MYIDAAINAGERRSLSEPPHHATAHAPRAESRRDREVGAVRFPGDADFPWTGRGCTRIFACGLRLAGHTFAISKDQQLAHIPCRIAACEAISAVEHGLEARFGRRVLRRTTNACVPNTETGTD